MRGDRKTQRSARIPFKPPRIQSTKKARRFGRALEWKIA
jgi:hypothetical protein